jgi:hypothetical protein
MRPRLTTHSTGAEIARLSSARLDAWLDVSRPVNSGVRCFRFANEQIHYNESFSHHSCL